MKFPDRLRGWLGTRHAPWITFASAFLVRALIALVLPQRIVWYDGERYYSIAQHLQDGLGFGDLNMNRLSVPTQPLLIAGIESIVGRENFLGLRLGMALIGAVGCYLGYRLAVHWFGRRAAFVAGIGLALYPMLAYTSALFEYPQTLFITLMAAYLLLFRRFQVEARPLALLGAAVCLGLATLTVPTVLLYLPFFLLCVAVARPVALARNLALAVVTLAVVIGAWTWRNYSVYHRPVLINAAGGLNLWIANNETYYEHGKAAIIPKCGPGFEQSRYCLDYIEMEARLLQEYPDIDDRIFASEAASKKLAMDFILGSPGRFVLLSVRRFAVFWSPFTGASSADEGTGGGAREWVAALTYLPILALGLIGAYITRRRWREFLPLYFYVLTLAGAHSIFLPTARYRIPVDFLLILFAGAAIALALDRRSVNGGPAQPR